ncbi:MAG: Eco57I restriction-modification methylase domain-containing protein, partial [Burkholderiales bacterium]
MTDFEEFAVYDSRVKPDKSDSPAKARVVYFTFREYSKRWDEISSIFSKEAVLKGSFDRYADTNKAKRGTAEVDAAFLAEIESWRELLARNIALRNPGLTQRELNFAVQQTIDRIIFLRICEARDIEPYGQLQSLMNGGSVYARLRQIFHHADERYNSGLFHFRTEAGRAVPDELTLRLAIDDKPLKEIFGKLYYPDSPYAFSVLPTTILGQVYEQFLGKVIRLTPGGQAKVADKPEVKKAGGVYYTPAYIVEYLVKNTVGKLLEGKTLGQIGGGARHAPLRVLDPACGSGSFLLVAYQYLLDWYLARYSESEPEKYAKGKSPRIFKGQGGSWRVTTNERKRILLTHIFGVDIDPQAVEVTKLSLLLKILEGHSGEIIQGLYLHERLLPDLDNNIKCGNSLIGSDFYEGQFNFDEEERLRINAFDWNAEFSEIFKAGGFDVVIGNPPYLNVDDVWGRQDPRLAALKALYAEIYNDKTDILFYFLGKAISLSKTLVGFIVSRAFLEAYKADKLRSHLLKHSAIKEVIDFRDLYVFQGVGITTCLITLRPREKAGDVSAYRFLQKMFPPLPLANLLHDPKYFARVQLPQGALSHQPWSFVSDLERKLNSKVDDRGKPLGSILEIGQGMQTGRNQIFGGHTRHSLEEWDLRHGQYLKRATNSAIRRFWIDGGNEFLLYLEDVEEFHHLPSAVRDYLTSHS